MVLTTETGCRIALGLILVTLAGIGLPHRLRADRVGGRVSVRGDPAWFWSLMLVVAPAVALVCGAFLVRPAWVRFAEFAVPPGWRAIGAVIGAAGVIVFGWMFRHLGLNVTSTSTPRANATLVTTGPYRWVRHPMYTAALLLVAAAALLTANLVVLAGGIGMFALLAARSRREERRLVEKFGDEYRAYQRRTGRFLPWIGSDR